ncbi:apo-citrate lyase phosphoribosyl-dephospho-CoA transferase [Desulfuromonas versatilis]|uniref:citrate lyase holo-[acyl-carrier protein] synthase n=1 Tax=Desulfuromonas versatilis TaxID=2802975 RepID=A0ABM8HWN8_9BACT|nr:citrate lyase holo-[acyl-carrier protein] synthase [Desulfuromonas versatilis]BCR05530.1 apo-citrate lyase phosphoribosyl-dephospho-CoA transferase [Desulfuromonas versatilis]
MLAARDRRHLLLQLALRPERAAVLTLSLNIPGAEKQPAGSKGLFQWAERRLGEALPGLKLLYRKTDGLGPYALFATGQQAPEAKRRCIQIENAEPFSRLLDIDVYDPTGRAIDRAALGQTERSCLVCGKPARECIRLGLHQPEELTRRVHELIAPFAG